MRVLVTGAAGFIGSSVSERLLARGDEVLGLDNFDPFYGRAIKERNLAGLRARAGFSFTEGNILDDSLIRELVGRTDRVVHLAALAGVRPSIAEPARYMKVNVEGTTVILEACRLAGVERLVVAGEPAFQRTDDGHGPNAKHQAGGNESLGDVCAFACQTVFDPATELIQPGFDAQPLPDDGAEGHAHDDDEQGV